MVCVATAENTHMTTVGCNAARFDIAWGSVLSLAVQHDSNLELFARQLA